MTSVHDPRYAKHQHYRFPLSSSSSGTVTPLSSPRISPTLDQVPQIVDNLFSFRPSHSLTSVRLGKQRELSNTTDSDCYNTEKYSSRKRPRNTMKKTLSHTPGTEPISQTLHHGRSSTSITSSKSLSRLSRSTSSSSSSSSYFSTPPDREETAIHHPNVGKGRKVAAKLQLFKETSGPSEDPSTGEHSEVNLGVEPFQEVEDVAEAFEFVKRSEWPARETAATRRDRSMTLLERTKTRDSSINDQVERERNLSLREAPPFDVAQWRRDLFMSRGRRRERALDELPDETENPQQNIHPFPYDSPPIFIRPRSRTYHPSPSPPPSSSSKSKAFYHHVPETSPLSSVPPMAKHPHLPSIRTTCYSRSPTPVRTDTVSNPISPLESLSSWSTDDESLWETASTASTVASNTSAYHSPPLTLLQKLPEALQVSEKFSHLDQENLLKITPFGSIDDETLAVNVNLPEERLPHIPLRPFRNQVGGHSAIYKFTKEAVCKVRFIAYFKNSFSSSLFLATCIA